MSNTAQHPQKPQDTRNSQLSKRTRSNGSVYGKSDDLDDKSDGSNSGGFDNRAENNSSIDKSHDSLTRSMESRHLTMISLGGVIGTGLFVSSGYTIHQAGPLGAILAYAIGSILVYTVMLSLGELSVAMPYAGSFHLYAKRFIGPGTAFTIAILYWLNWIVALASEFTAAGVLMQRWFPHSPVWAWSAAFIALVLLLNVLSVRLYGEAEFWFASIKVVAIILFMVVGLLAIVGILPSVASALGAASTSGTDAAAASSAAGAASTGENISAASYALHNLFGDGLLPNGIAPVLSTLLTVTFAFSGTEVVAVAAGETRDPKTAIPKAIHTSVLRLVIFFIGSISVMAALIPWRQAGVNKSPFVLVFEQVGLPFAGDIMNVVVLTAVLSAANSGLYVSSRMVWSMAKEQMLPQFFGTTNQHGVPIIAVLVSLTGGLLALLSSVIAVTTVYLALVAVSGLATLLVWLTVAICHMRFRSEWVKQGHSPSELSYQARWYPVTPIVAIVLCLLVLVMVAFDPSQRTSLLYMVPVVIACYAWVYWKKR